MHLRACSLASETAALMTSSAPESLQPACRIFSSKTSRVPCFSPGDIGGDRGVRQVLVDVRPLLVGVGDQLAVDDHFGGEAEIEILRRELQVGIAAVGGEDDAVIADLDFLDFGDAGGLAGLQLAVLDLARSIGDVDRVRANALAEFLEARAGAAGFDDRGLEVGEGLAEGFRDDLGVGKNGGRAGNLDLVASGGSAGKGDGRHEGGCGKLEGVHRNLPKWAGGCAFAAALSFFAVNLSATNPLAADTPSFYVSSAKHL